MPAKYNLQRFIDAQKVDYKLALTEITNGRKRSHWMWYIFPQIQGLGFSGVSKFYAIADLTEASEYLQHPVLGVRLIEITSKLLDLQENDATEILGTPDDMKLRSSMTLFASVSAANPIFQSVLKKFFNENKDARTMQILGLN